MEKKLSKQHPLFWRFLPIIIGIIWVADYLFRIFVLSAVDFEYSLLPLHGHIVICGVSALVFVLATLFPYQFYIYAAFCWLWGLFRLVDGGAINALVIHLLAYVFLYRKGFFNTGRRYKLLAGSLALIAAIASQIRLGPIVFCRHLIRFVDFSFIVAIAAVMLWPEIKLIEKNRKEMLLRLNRNLFTAKDVIILEKILAGDKYEAIARDTDMAVSTLKKYIHQLFMRLKVSDRISFLSMYAKHRIIRED